MIIHLVFDLISSIFVVISCFMVKYFGIYALDPMSCFFISIVLIVSIFPLLKNIYKNLFWINNYDFSSFIKALNGSENKFFEFSKTLLMRSDSDDLLIIVVDKT